MNERMNLWIDEGWLHGWIMNRLIGGRKNIWWKAQAGSMKQTNKLMNLRMHGK